MTEHFLEVPQFALKANTCSALLNSFLTKQKSVALGCEMKCVCV